MELVLLVALGVCLGLVLWNFLPEILGIGAMLAVGVLVVLFLYVFRNDGKSQQASSESAQLGAVASTAGGYKSLSERVSNGPPITFDAEGTTGTLVGVVNKDAGRYALLLNLSERFDTNRDPWTARRAVEKFKSKLCGRTGLLAHYHANAKNVSVVVYAATDHIGELTVPVAECVADGE